MTKRPSADRLLRRTALAGYGAAAAAGAVTIGLIAGITHTASEAATESKTVTSTTTTTTPTTSTPTTSTPSTTTPSTSTSTSSSDTSGSTGVGSTQQSTTPVGGSNGS